MKIAIIGAGFTGLSAGFKLAKKGHEVVMFESGLEPGGLAGGFKEKNWKWSLENHYHHLFKTDHSIQKLANEIGHELIFVRPKTSTYFNGEIRQIDSPINLMKFKSLSIEDRLRTGAILAYLKATNSWETLEKVSTKKFLVESMGKKSWDVLWKPLMEKKFGEFSGDIPASWFWARVKTRTASLGYPERGFKEFAKSIAKVIQKNGGKIFYGTSVEKISKSRNGFKIQTSKGDIYEFDKVICTLPNPIFVKITKGLTKDYVNKLMQFKGIGATNLVLQLDESFLEDGTYWLNINDTEMPFLCVVEHTNFMPTKKYGGQKIIYVGNYLHSGHNQFSLSEKEVLNEYFPHLKRINAKFKKSWINKARLFKAGFAQPIITKNYSKKIPAVKTPIDGLYLANMSQVYPWDRGTNYAVELGDKVAEEITNDN